LAVGARGVVTSYGSVWRIVHDAGISFKKLSSPPSRIVATSHVRRRRWKARHSRLDRARLSLIDETLRSDRIEAPRIIDGPRPFAADKYWLRHDARIATFACSEDVRRAAKS
jgi:hypothetical protein